MKKYFLLFLASLCCAVSYSQDLLTHIPSDVSAVFSLNGENLFSEQLIEKVKSTKPFKEKPYFFESTFGLSADDLKNLGIDYESEMFGYLSYDTTIKANYFALLFDIKKTKSYDSNILDNIQKLNGFNYSVLSVMNSKKESHLLFNDRLGTIVTFLDKIENNNINNGGSNYKLNPDDRDYNLTVRDKCGFDIRLEMVLNYYVSKVNMPGGSNRNIIDQKVTAALKDLFANYSCKQLRSSIRGDGSFKGNSSLEKELDSILEKELSNYILFNSSEIYRITSSNDYYNMEIIEEEIIDEQIIETHLEGTRLISTIYIEENIYYGFYPKDRWITLEKAYEYYQIEKAIELLREEKYYETWTNKEIEKRFSSWYPEIKELELEQKLKSTSKQTKFLNKITENLLQNLENSVSQNVFFNKQNNTNADLNIWVPNYIDLTTDFVKLHNDILYPLSKINIKKFETSFNLYSLKDEISVSNEIMLDENISESLSKMLTSQVSKEFYNYYNKDKNLGYAYFKFNSEEFLKEFAPLIYEIGKKENFNHEIDMIVDMIELIIDEKAIAQLLKGDALILFNGFNVLDNKMKVPDVLFLISSKELPIVGKVINYFLDKKLITDLGNDIYSINGFEKDKKIGGLFFTFKNDILIFGNSKSNLLEISNNNYVSVKDKEFKNALKNNSVVINIESQKLINAIKESQFIRIRENDFFNSLINEYSAVKTSITMTENNSIKTEFTIKTPDKYFSALGYLIDLMGKL